MNNVFQTELNTALEELQQHLQGLGAAKTQLEQTRSAASDVVTGVNRLSGDYTRHLGALTERIDAFLTESTARSKDFHSEAATRITQLQENYERKSQLMLGNIQSAHNQETKMHLDRINEQLLNFLNSTNESIEATVTEMNKQIMLMNDMNNRQNGQVKEYMVRFERLMRAVHEMEERISTVNFPALFAELNQTVISADKNNRQMLNEISDLKKHIRLEMKAHTKVLETKIQNQVSAIRLMQILVVVMFVGMLIMMYLIY